MAGKAKSDTKKKQLASEAKEELQARAVAAYQEELARRNLGLKSRGAQAICNEYMILYAKETGKQIHLNHATIIRHANGGRSRTTSNQEKAWLFPEETEVVVSYIIELGNRGFPLSHKRLKEHVDDILRARLGDEFPESGVGKRWTNRFIEKHSDRIKMSWASPLEEKRGRAVNPNTNKAWFDLLGKTIKDYEIVEETTYGTDEIGCTGSTGQRERVMGSWKKGPQYQQGGGGRENTTVIVTICADGTSTPPAVIFKGNGYQVNWKQNNPANASIGYAKKGWTNGEIGVEWIKDFNQRTEAKANGRYRLLLVDGHNSHYTRGFLEYARTHKILILCYPSHATHVYQGLDVVVFAMVKRILREERDKYERATKEKMQKSNFLTIYGQAHLRALTPEIIKSAFRATGVWPFNRDVVTEATMAPSKETSCEGQLPVVPATPVRIIAQILREVCIIKDDLPDSSDDEDETENLRGRLEFVPEGGSEELVEIATGVWASCGAVSEDSEEYDGGGEEHQAHDSHGNPASISRAPDPTDAIQKAVQRLSESDLARLINPSSERNTRTVIRTNMISRSERLNIVPQTPEEHRLLAALHDAEAEIASLKRSSMELQATNILNENYCKTLREQLEFQEEKKKNPKGKGKLMGDGLPVLLSGDWFYDRVVEYEVWQEKEAQKKAERLVAKESQQAAMVEYHKEVEKRKEAIAERRAEWEQEKMQWAVDRAAARLAKTRFRVLIPKLGKLPPVVPRPKMTVNANLEGEEDDDSDENDADGEEDDSD